MRFSFLYSSNYFNGKSPLNAQQYLDAEPRNVFWINLFQCWQSRHFEPKWTSLDIHSDQLISMHEFSSELNTCIVIDEVRNDVERKTNKTKYYISFSSFIFKFISCARLNADMWIASFKTFFLLLLFILLHSKWPYVLITNTKCIISWKSKK